MKSKHLILIFLFIVSAKSRAQTNHQTIEVAQVDSKKNNCVEIPSTFSHEILSESKSLNALKSKKIRRVELIYTRYKENADFDQNQLNEDRMSRLNQLLPKLQIDKPEIVWIEQIGATTSTDAKNYFHGFRIYTDVAPVARTYQRTHLNDLANPAVDFLIDNTIGGTFSHPSGTQIHIPANAVIYDNGKPVFGKYTISYSEYRNAAEILFSGLPMEFKDKTGSYLFNSAGMYEIRGTKDGQTLALQKDLSIDFNCTKNEAGVNFYEMNDQTGEWNLLKSDLFSANNPNETPSAKPEIMSANSEQRIKRGIAPDNYETEGSSKVYQQLNLVYGLISSKFGVYNCDQIFRIANKTIISPKYLDVSSKKPIKNQNMICLIDKDVNASFSFGVKQITCNSQGENIFLLFTEDGEIYALKSEKDKRVNLNQKEPEFLMENITNKVKTSDDLKSYLNI